LEESKKNVEENEELTEESDGQYVGRLISRSNSRGIRSTRGRKKRGVSRIGTRKVETLN